MPTTVLILGDLHCGAVPGLTPPSYMPPRLQETQGKLWDFYVDAVKSNGPWDLMIGTGDFTDGEGKKDQLGLLLPDVSEQSECAAECLSIAGVKGRDMFLVRGTPFHSSGTSNYEDSLAEALGASIADEQYLDIEGVKIHVRHAVGGSATPYGQGSMLFKESVRDLTEAAASDQIPADIIIRGHVHYSARVTVGNRTAISAPCLELPESVYGRTCKAFHYHVGIGKLVIRGPRDWSYRPILMPFRSVKPREYKWVTK